MKSRIAPYILVVDDYGDTPALLCRYLRSRGFACSSAANGQEALDVAFETPPSIILMDMAMSGMDGWEATRRLRADPRTRDATILAVTGSAHPTLQRDCVAAGCDGVVAKPYNVEALGNVLLDVMKHGRTALKDLGQIGIKQPFSNP